MSNIDIIAQKQLNDLEKGGKRAQIGEKRMFGGREYIKTAEGWKYHGKGRGKKAQAHAAGTQKKRTAQQIQKDIDEQKRSLVLLSDRRSKSTKRSRRSKQDVLKNLEKLRAELESIKNKEQKKAKKKEIGHEEQLGKDMHVPYNLSMVSSGGMLVSFRDAWEEPDTVANIAGTEDENSKAWKDTVAKNKKDYDKALELFDAWHHSGTLTTGELKQGLKDIVEDGAPYKKNHDKWVEDNFKGIDDNTVVDEKNRIVDKQQDLKEITPQAAMKILDESVEESTRSGRIDIEVFAAKGDNPDQFYVVVEADGKRGFPRDAYFAALNHQKPVLPDGFEYTTGKPTNWGGEEVTAKSIKEDDERYDDRGYTDSEFSGGVRYAVTYTGKLKKSEDSVDILANQVLNDLEKGGKPAQEGEEREWGGRTYVKQGGKWIEKTKGREKKKEDEPKGKSPKKEDDSKGKSGKSEENKGDKKTGEVRDSKRQLQPKFKSQLKNIKRLFDSGDSAKLVEAINETPEELHAAIPEEVWDKYHAHDEEADQEVTSEDWDEATGDEAQNPILDKYNELKDAKGDEFHQFIKNLDNTEAEALYEDAFGKDQNIKELSMNTIKGSLIDGKAFEHFEGGMKASDFEELNEHFEMMADVELSEDFNFEDFAQEHFNVSEEDLLTALYNLEDEDVMKDIAEGDYSSFDISDSSIFNDGYEDMMADFDDEGLFYRDPDHFDSKDDLMVMIKDEGETTDVFEALNDHFETDFTEQDIPELGDPDFRSQLSFEEIEGLVELAKQEKESASPFDSMPDKERNAAIKESASTYKEHAAARGSTEDKPKYSPMKAEKGDVFKVKDLLGPSNSFTITGEDGKKLKGAGERNIAFTDSAKELEDGAKMTISMNFQKPVTKDGKLTLESGVGKVEATLRKVGRSMFFEINGKSEEIKD